MLRKKEQEKSQSSSSHNYIILSMADGPIGTHGPVEAWVRQRLFHGKAKVPGRITLVTKIPLPPMWCSQTLPALKNTCTYLYTAWMLFAWPVSPLDHGHLHWSVYPINSVLIFIQGVPGILRFVSRESLTSGEPNWAGPQVPRSSQHSQMSLTGG